MPQSPLSHQLPQEVPPLPHPTVWQQLPESQRQQCHDLIAQLLTTLVHSAQSEEPRHE
jgi:hypothetical protein